MECVKKSVELEDFELKWTFYPKGKFSHLNTLHYILRQIKIYGSWGKEIKLLCHSSDEKVTWPFGLTLRVI